MVRYLLIAGLMTAAVVLLVAPAPAEEPTTQPSKDAEGDIAAQLKTATTWARWGCILAGLALLGVLWVGYSMQTLAKNQVQLGRMIRAGKEE